MRPGVRRGFVAAGMTGVPTSRLYHFTAVYVINLYNSRLRKYNKNKEVMNMGLFDKLIKEGSKALNELSKEENKEKATSILGGIMEVAGFTAVEENESTFSFRKPGTKPASSAPAYTPTPSAAGGLFQEVSASDSMFGQSGQSSAEDLMYQEDTSGLTCREKILRVLADEFPRYDVKENVSPHTIGGQGRFMNYSIGVYDMDKPVLFIMIIGKTTTSHREYRWSREEAEKRGITFLNFIEHYPNRVEYIKERLHKYI